MYLFDVVSATDFRRNRTAHSSHHASGPDRLLRGKSMADGETECQACRHAAFHALDPSFRVSAALQSRFCHSRPPES
jgi:hypothetical protein